MITATLPTPPALVAQHAASYLTPAFIANDIKTKSNKRAAFEGYKFRMATVTCLSEGPGYMYCKGVIRGNYGRGSILLRMSWNVRTHPNGSYQATSTTS